VNFAMLVTARACQGVFGAMLAPAALSLLTTTFQRLEGARQGVRRLRRDRRRGQRGRAAARRRADRVPVVALVPLHQTWCSPAPRSSAGCCCSKPQARVTGGRLDVPGVVMVSSGVFCLVYGFSNAAQHSWSASSSWGFLTAGVVLLIAFAVWQGRTGHPLLPPRVVLDRNRGGAYLAIMITGMACSGIFLFLTYYMQVSLGYSPVVSGLAFLPMVPASRSRRTCPTSCCCRGSARGRS